MSCLKRQRGDNKYLTGRQKFDEIYNLKVSINAVIRYNKPVNFPTCNEILLLYFLSVPEVHISTKSFILNITMPTSLLIFLEPQS